MEQGKWGVGRDGKREGKEKDWLVSNEVGQLARTSFCVHSDSLDKGYGNTRAMTSSVIIHCSNSSWDHDLCRRCRRRHSFTFWLGFFEIRHRKLISCSCGISHTQQASRETETESSCPTLKPASPWGCFPIPPTYIHNWLFCFSLIGFMLATICFSTKK